MARLLRVDDLKQRAAARSRFEAHDSPPRVSMGAPYRAKGRGFSASRVRGGCRDDRDGLDQHRAQVTADWLDIETGEVSRARVVPADRAGVRRFLARLAGQRLEVALEATTGWRFVVEELRAVGAEPHLAEPAEASALKGNKKRAKTDRGDARPHPARARDRRTRRLVQHDAPAPGARRPATGRVRSTPPDPHPGQPIGRDARAQARRSPLRDPAARERASDSQPALSSPHDPRPLRRRPSLDRGNQLTRSPSDPARLSGPR